MTLLQFDARKQKKVYINRKQIIGPNELVQVMQRREYNSTILIYFL